MAIKQKFFVHFSSNAFNMVLHTLAGIVVARIAGPLILGTINYATSYVAMYAMVLGLFSASHTKLVSEGRDLGDCIKTYATLQTSMIIVYTLLFGVLFVRSKTATGGAGLQTLDIVILITFATNLIRVFMNIITGTFGARTELAKQSIPFMADSLIYNILRVTVVVAGFGAIALATSSLISAIIVMPITLFLFRKYPSGRFDKQLAKRYFGTSFYFFIIGIATIFLQNYGKVFLKDNSSVLEVGIFSGGYSIAGMLMMIGTTSGTVFFPTFSRLISEHKLDSVAKQIYTYQRFLLVFVLPVVVLISLHSGFIINTILGAQYSESSQVLALLIISSFLIIFFLPYGNLLIGKGELTKAVCVAVSQVIIYFVLLYLFVGKHTMNKGSLGLAYAMLISYLYAGLSYFFFSRNVVRYQGVSHALKSFALAILLYLALGLILAYLGSTWFVAIISSILFLCIYYLLSYLMKLASKEDLLILKDLFNPRKTKEYINNEISEKI